MKATTISAIVTIGMATSFAMQPAQNAETAMTNPVRVVLIGASIGEDWNLEQLPARAPLSGHEFETLQAWQYDKSERLDETLMRPSRKFRLTPSYFKEFFAASPQPADIVILKECSSYFPDDTDAARKRALFENWVQRVNGKKLKVMVATVVPVTKARAARDAGKQEGLRAFNDWLRDYARTNSIPLLDLEAALRTDNRERYLRDDLTSGDGSHLNRKAYDILDGVMVKALCDLESGGTCQPAQASAR